MDAGNGYGKLTNAVTRTIAILEALSRQECANLEDLARTTDLPKATLLRFLSTLTALGYIRRDGNGMYHLTLRMFTVGSGALKHTDLLKTARPYAEDLARTLGETVQLWTREGNGSVCILSILSSHILRIYSREGLVIPMYCTAAGKALLAAMPSSSLLDYLAAVPLKPFTPNTITEEEALKEDIRGAAERGWAMDDEEFEEDIISIAAPIMDRASSAAAAISVSWPSFRFSRAEARKHAGMIKAAAGSISGLLGSPS